MLVSSQVKVDNIMIVFAVEVPPNAQETCCHAVRRLARNVAVTPWRVHPVDYYCTLYDKLYASVAYHSIVRAIEPLN